MKKIIICFIIAGGIFSVSGLIQNLAMDEFPGQSPVALDEFPGQSAPLIAMDEFPSIKSISKG
ncbi:hypothetical protein SAMN05428981_11554 [Bacillus sp. OV194]|nr:hypothetical protein SAMN05428981_11554 [Bacillus sp. OV194]